MRDKDANNIISGQLKQLPRIGKFPPGDPRRPDYSAGRRDRDWGAPPPGRPCLKGRTVSDRPVGVNKRKLDEDVSEAADSHNKRVKTRDFPEPEVTARSRVKPFEDRNCGISGPESSVSKEELGRWCSAWLLLCYVQLCGTNLLTDVKEEEDLGDLP